MINWIALLPIGVGLVFLLPPLFFREVGPYKKRVERAAAAGVPRWLSHLGYALAGAAMITYGGTQLVVDPRPPAPPSRPPVTEGGGDRRPPQPANRLVVLARRQDSGDERLAVVLRLRRVHARRLRDRAQQLGRPDSAVLEEAIGAARLDVRGIERYRDARGRPNAQATGLPESSEYTDGVYYLHADRVEGLEQLGASLELTAGQLVELLLDREGSMR